MYVSKAKAQEIFDKLQHRDTILDHNESSGNMKPFKSMLMAMLYAPKAQEIFDKLQHQDTILNHNESWGNMVKRNIIISQL